MNINSQGGLDADIAILASVIDVLVAVRFAESVDNLNSVIRRYGLATVVAVGVHDDVVSRGVRGEEGSDRIRGEIFSGHVHGRFGRCESFGALVEYIATKMTADRMLRSFMAVCWEGLSGVAAIVSS